MSIIQVSELLDCVDLFPPQGLYLKTIARINESVQLPQLKKAGAKISNSRVVARIKEMARPYTIPVYKVCKSSLDFIRFECQVENYTIMEHVLAKLDTKTVKLADFQETLQVRAEQAETPPLTSADWDSFFRENKGMNHDHDTIKLENLPCNWFVDNKSDLACNKPSESVLKRAFSTFGQVRIVDIPMLDPLDEGQYWWCADFQLWQGSGL